MKKILLTAAALAALVAGPALGADLSRPAPVYKAPPPPAPVYSWTGCYVGGGGGYGMWNQDIQTDFGRGEISQTTTAGGRGWFGTVQVGCDYQVSSDWVIGAFGDWDFGDIKGKPEITDTRLFGHEKQKWSWAAGARLGYVVMPNLLAYVSGGFTEAHFDGFGLLDSFDGDPTRFSIPGHTYHGWFVGTGYEYGLKWLPGFFWKTEYRYSQFSGATLPFVCTGTANQCVEGPGVDIHSKKFEQAIRSELVWRFNWAGPVRAAY
jgi:outer membrane immunogenic protein